MNQKTNYAAPALWGNSRRDWLRRHALASIKRPLPQIEKEETYTQDKDYRDDDEHRINLLTQPPLTTKEHTIASQADQNESTPDDQPSSQTTEEVLTAPPRYLSSPAISPSRSIKEYVAEKMEKRT